MVKENKSENEFLSYSMKEGHYRVSVWIWEASDLIPWETNGSSDPFCVVSIGDQK